MKQIFSLSGAWRMKRLSGGDWLEARVPGSVYADLLRAGRMPDPFFRDNEDEAFDLMRDDYLYERTFMLSAAQAASPSLDLVFHGLDTIAEVSVNRWTVLKADNMHRTWRVDLRPYVQAGENTLRVLFFSPVRAAEQAYARDGMEGSREALPGFASLRKAHCMFGWDWGPRLPDAGIWRDVELEITDRARLSSVLIRQRLSPDGAELSLKPEIVCLNGDERYRVLYTLTGPDGQEIYAGTEESVLRVPAPRLWWPNGCGEQPLYTLSAVLTDENGEALDEYVRRIGLRDIRLIRPAQEGGREGFALQVNSQPVFAMGADYIPQDCVLSRVTPEKTRELLKDCARAHMNLIRVWGGGYYPPDWFYDICDELGLMVWQDFMFACAEYRLDEAMEENLRAEFRDNIVRLRHHASLALWCGNNEVESAIAEKWYKATARIRADYLRIFMGILPETLRLLDPDRPYWPSSPSTGGDLLHPSDERAGDTHYWRVWHGNVPFSDYRSHDFGFVSEFGFQAFPPLKTVESYTLPEDRNIFSYIMERHQRNFSANGKMLSYLSSLYPYPSSLDLLIYASQLMQLEAIRCGVEYWRSRRGTCMGAIYWQLNDNWPVASWASIDYYGRWKALHYGARRFFAPVTLICLEEGEHTQRPNPNAPPTDPPVRPSAGLYAANETPVPECLTVRWSVRDNMGNPRGEAGEKTVTVPPFSVGLAVRLDLPGLRFREEVLDYALLRGETELAHGSALFCAPKYFRFADPALTVTRQGDTLTVAARAYARFVEVVPLDGDAVLSDNDFDMFPGKRQLTILRGDATRFGVRSVFDIR